MKKYFELILFFLCCTSLFAHVGESQPAYQVTGTVFDGSTHTTVAFVTVAIFALPDSSLVTGSITNQQGTFSCDLDKAGSFFVKLSFMGYQNKIIPLILDAARTADLGKIILERSHYSLIEVEISASRDPIAYKIDRKVIKADLLYTAASGTAVDILEKVPSVTVDVEGNVSLRGSGSFTVLIDGRPTVLDAGDALKQIPSSMIDEIEIITNPSAKYDPEGTSGIINIITKKQEFKGTSTMISGNMGMYKKYGGELLLTSRKRKATLTLGANYNRMHTPGTQNTQTTTYHTVDSAFTVSSAGSSYRNFERYGITGGIDYRIDSSHTMGLQMRIGGMAIGFGSQLNFTETLNNSHPVYAYSDEFMKHLGQFISSNLMYRYTSANKKTTVDADYQYKTRMGDEASENVMYNLHNEINSSSKATEVGPMHGWEAKVNVEQKFSETSSLEAGGEGKSGISVDDYEMFVFDTLTRQYEKVEAYSHYVDYNRKIFSGYALIKGEMKKFGYQAGLRSEYTNRKTIFDKASSSTINRFDFFPTLHISYSFDEEHQLMGSYTRRIARPRGWQLEPFLVWIDEYNVRSGNPDLLPENVDAYEINCLWRKDKFTFSLESFYHITHNSIERVRTVYDQNILYHKFENVGKNYALGLEAMWVLNSVKWWQVDVMGSLYHYKVIASFDDWSIDQTSLNYLIKWHNTLKFNKRLRVQLGGLYHGPSVWAQGRTKGFISTNAAIRYDLIKNKLTGTLVMDDLLNLEKHQTTYEGNRFHTVETKYYAGPRIMLSVKYAINSYTHQQPRRNAGGGGELEEF